MYKIDRLVVHFIDNKTPKIVRSKAEIDLDKLEDSIKVFLEKLMHEVFTQTEKGSTFSANFSEDKPFLTRERVEKIIDEPEATFSVSQMLAESLFAATPANASTGLLCVFRIVGPANKVHVLLLKVKNVNENFVKLNEIDLAEIASQKIENLLVDEVQKAAVFPHPNRQDFQVKVIDNSNVDDPADYFGQKFLGVVTKKSDEHQIANLVPSLEEYAAKLQKNIPPGKLLSVIDELRAGKKDITTPFLTRIIKEVNLYGETVDLDDFSNFIDTESSVGSLGIPATSFVKKGQKLRKSSVEFRTPALASIKISGSYEAIKQILQDDGQTTRLVIEVPSRLVKLTYGK